MIYTSQFAYKGDKERLDITITADTPFSPTWKRVSDYKTSGSEVNYKFYYHWKMQRSYEYNFQYWKKTLDFSVDNDIVLVYYCKAGNFCHRLLLADYLEKVAKSLNINTRYKGELK